MHKRKQIRNHIQSILLNKTVVGSNVVASRYIHIPDDSLPCIKVYTTDESSVIDVEAPRELKRSLLVNIEIVGKGFKGSDVDDVLDDISEEVEAVMDVDDSLNPVPADPTKCLAGRSWLSSTTPDPSIDGSHVICMLILQYTVEYYTLSPSTTPSDKFDTLQVKAKSNEDDTTQLSESFIDDIHQV